MVAVCLLWRQYLFSLFFVSILTANFAERFGSLTTIAAQLSEDGLSLRIRTGWMNLKPLSRSLLS
jgi:hypothetical protein